MVMLWIDSPAPTNPNQINGRWTLINATALQYIFIVRAQLPHDLSHLHATTFNLVCDSLQQRERTIKDKKWSS